MSVEFADVGVMSRLHTLAQYALPDSRPSWAPNLALVPKGRFWPVASLPDQPGRRLTATARVRPVTDIAPELSRAAKRRRLE